MRALALLASSVLICSATPSAASEPSRHNTEYARSADGTKIAYECAGSGPEILIVHGGTGNRTRWLPMFPYLTGFTACAMDRRAHGQSEDGAAYSLAREAEDIRAVVEQRGRPVTVVGHSFGAVAAYEAAFMTPRIKALVLYEPPIGISDHSKTLGQMEALIRAGDREQAAQLFFKDIVQLSSGEIRSMRTRPAWKSIVDGIEKSMRQDRALTANGWKPERASKLHIPTLLLVGSNTKNVELRGAIDKLAGNLPIREVVSLEGQEHNAMDTDRAKLATVIATFVRKQN